MCKKKVCEHEICTKFVMLLAIFFSVDLGRQVAGTKTELDQNVSHVADFDKLHETMESH